MTGAGSAGIDWNQFPVKALSNAIASLRPMHGDVTVIDGYGGFKKLMEEDSQAAAHGAL